MGAFYKSGVPSGEAHVIRNIVYRDPHGLPYLFPALCATLGLGRSRHAGCQGVSQYRV